MNRISTKTALTTNTCLRLSQLAGTRGQFVGMEFLIYSSTVDYPTKERVGLNPLRAELRVFCALGGKRIFFPRQGDAMNRISTKNLAHGFSPPGKSERAKVQRSQRKGLKGRVQSYCTEKRQVFFHSGLSN